MADLRSNFWARIDWITLGVYLVLVLIGWMTIYSANYEEGQEFRLFDLSVRHGRQFVYILAALLIGLVVLVVDSKFWGFFAYPVYGVMIFLLVAVLLVGTEINGAKSWFVFGPVSLQPTEFAKLGTILAMAKLLSGFNFKIHNLKNLLIITALIGLPLVLVFLQNDTGSAMVYLALLLVLFREGLTPTFLIVGFLSILLFFLTLVFPLPGLIAAITVITVIFTGLVQKSFRYFVIGLAVPAASYLLVVGILMLTKIELPDSRHIIIAGLITALVLIFFLYRKRISQLYIVLLVWFGSLMLITSVDYVFNEVIEPHQRSRINIMLGIDSDPLGRGYNLNQSKIAIGNGGLFGKGFLKGPQNRFNFVPEQSTDFIFCTIGEEWGFLGSLVLLSLFIGLLLRLIYMAERQRSPFSRIFGYGVVSVLFFHFLVNIGMTIGLVPVIGIPLPFFSYGGSSLWGFSLLIFVFLRLDTDRFEVVA